MVLYYVLTLIHVIVCLFLIGVVLLQSGKAADLAGAFGGMGSQTAFGPRGAATVLTKATTIAAALFMVTSLSLSIMATRNQGSAATVLDSVAQPAAPAPKAPESKTGGATLPVTIPGQQPASAPVTKGGTDTKGFQVPEVQIGGEKTKLPAPGEPGGLIIPEGTSQEEIKKRVAAEMERLKKLDAEAAKQAGQPAPPATKKQ